MTASRPVAGFDGVLWLEVDDTNGLNGGQITGLRLIVTEHLPEPPPPPKQEPAPASSAPPTEVEPADSDEPTTMGQAPTESGTSDPPPPPAEPPPTRSFEGITIDLLEQVDVTDFVADPSASEWTLTQPVTAPLSAAGVLELVVGMNDDPDGPKNKLVLEGSFVDGEELSYADTGVDDNRAFVLFGSDKKLIVEPNQGYAITILVAKGQSLTISGGHADILLDEGGALLVSYTQQHTPEPEKLRQLRLRDAGAVTFAVDLLLSLGAGADGVGTEIAVPVRPDNGRLLRLTAPNLEPDSLLMIVDDASERLLITDDALPAAAAVLGGRLSLLAGDFFKGLESIAVQFIALQLASDAPVTVTTDGVTDGFALLGITLDIPLQVPGSSDAQPLGTGGGRLRFNRALVCESEADSADNSTGGAVELSLTLNDDAWVLADPKNPFTLQLHRNTAFKVSLDPTYPAVGVFGADGPAGTIFVPGVDANPDPATQARRFILDFAGQALDAEAVQDLPSRFMMGPGGVDMTAAVRPISVSMARHTDNKTYAIDEAKTLEGAFSMEGGDYLLYIKASSKLPYFQNASGTMEVTAASRGWVEEHGDGRAGSADVALHIRFTVNFERTWKDPSGLMELENPSVRIDIWWDGDWSMDAAMSGSLIINPAQRMGSGAKAWASGLFDHVKLDFNEVALSDFKENQQGLLDKVSLELVLARPVRISMWELLTLEIRSISLRWLGVEIGGRIGMTIKAASLEATLPNLVISLEDGVPKLGVAGVDDGNFSIYGKLVVEGQVSAEVEVTREHTRDREALSGMGSLAIQGLPTIRLAFRFGRLQVEGEWIPLIFLFGSVDYPIQLYKGIVLREYGAGFGVNQSLSGLEAGGALDQMSLAEWVQSPEAFPEPTNPADWVDDPGSFMLVARTFVAPSKLDTGAQQPYILDAIITLDERFNVVFMANAWLFTSIDDAKTKEFRENPVARGAIVIYSKNLTMEGYMESELSPAMGTPLDGLAGALSTVRTQYSFFASPDRLFMELGPIERSYDILSMKVSGSERYAVELANGDLLVLARWELKASYSFAKSLKFEFGPAKLEVGVSLTARFGMDALVAGGYIAGDLMVYTRLRVHMVAKLTLRVKAKLEVDAGFFKATVTLVDQSFNMQIVFDANLDGVVTTRGIGMQGTGNVQVKVMKWTLRFAVDVKAGRTDRLGTARTAFASKLNRLLA